ncbi:MAG: DUF362 domain-containing protein [Acidobacteria bacterium]|nr:DUF362 domain-containing protein [Acidobacteriota bacterium]
MRKDRGGLGRRELIGLGLANFAPVARPLAAAPARSLVVRVHSSSATRKWDYDAYAPWDHTVEMTKTQPGKIKERYYDYIHDQVVAVMLEKGLRELTGEKTAEASWRSLMPGFQRQQKVTLKLNMNNASFDPEITTNRMDQTMPLVNAILDHLIAGLGMDHGNITLLDAKRWFHPIIVKARCRHNGVRWVDSRSPDLWNTSESVVFTRDDPAPGGNFWMPRDYTAADHIINLCLMKNHGCGITGAMKSHFGSIPSPKCLHDGLGDKSYIADLCATPSIRKKVRVNIADALFANWHGNVWAPRAWNTFPEPSPNSLLLSRDPVALDSVMLDHIVEEIGTQGAAATSYVRDCVTHIHFLEYAMKHHGLGVFERRPYRRIQYSVLEA